MYDLKSFYASVECRERGLDPMKVNLVVADPNWTDKTICLAVSPTMKALGGTGAMQGIRDSGRNRVYHGTAEDAALH